MRQRGTRMGSILTLMACLRIRHSSKPSHELKIIFPRAGTVHMTSMQISFRQCSAYPMKSGPWQTSIHNQNKKLIAVVKIGRNPLGENEGKWWE